MHLQEQVHIYEDLVFNLVSSYRPTQMHIRIGFGYLPEEVEWLMVAGFERAQLLSETQGITAQHR